MQHWRLISLLALLYCWEANSQLELQTCYDTQGEPTRCEPLQQSFSFEKKPAASSTCGDSPTTFCTRSVRFGQLNSDCTATCDADDAANAHPPSHMTDFLQANTWWQSENSLEVQDTVVVDIPLGTLVEVSLVTFNFQSLIPSNFQIQKSIDYGQTYTDLHYLAVSCVDEYGISEDQVLSLDNETTVLCQLVNSPPFPGQISFFTVLDRPSLNDSTPGLSNELYEFMSATDIRVRLLEHYAIPNLAPDDLGYYYAIRDLNVLGACQCHGHASQCRPNTASNGNGYSCTCQHNTMGDFCERCADFYQDVPWQRATGETGFEACQICNCNGQSDECRFDADVYEETGRTSGGVCLNCRNNRAGRLCERCRELFYPQDDADNTFVCIPCDCNLAGVTDDGSCAQESSGEEEGGPVAGECSCKQNTQGRDCGECLPGFFNLSSDNDLGCQACDCSTNGSVGSLCDPVTGVCSCKPNVGGSRCDECTPGFFLPDPSSEDGCQPCSCNIGGSLGTQCDQTTGACSCRTGVEGTTCSAVQQGYFFRGVDYLILEAEEGAGIFDALIQTNPQSMFTGFGFAAVENGVTVLEFGQLTPPVSGLYEVAIRYSLTGAFTWSSATLTIQSTFSGDGTIECGDMQEVVGQSSFEYENWMMGSGLSVTRTFCFRGGEAYQFILDEFISGREDDSAVLKIDSLVMIPVDLPQLRTFADLVISRDYADCVALYRSLATRPLDPFTCRDTVFAVSTEIYDGAAACDCDIEGSVMGSVCAEFGGQCSCLPGTRGRRCDQCFGGFYNLTESGCRSCDCDPSGSLEELCDPVDGSCMCIDNVGGQTCSSCVAGFWGFDREEGCRSCGCDPIGSVTSQCDEQTGVCFCRDGVTGESCDRCQNLTFGFSSNGCSMCGCNSAGSLDETCDLTSGQCSCLSATTGRDCSECVPGTFNLQSSNPEGCQPCFCSGLSDVCQPAPGFYLGTISSVFDSGLLEGWVLVDGSTRDPSMQSALNGNEGIVIPALSDSLLEAPADYLGNQLSSYSQYISVELVPVTTGVYIEPIQEYHILLVGGGGGGGEIEVAANFSRTESGFAVLLHESAGWVRTDDMTSNYLSSVELQEVLSSLTHLLITASYNVDVVLTSISLDTALQQSETDDSADLEVGVTFVERCECPENYTGLSCDICSPGYTRDASGLCVLCSCNGFSSDCDMVTGTCLNCSDSTAGDSCEVCVSGFYGDPVGGVACLPCPCPLTTSAGSFADECILESGDVLCLDCPSGHTGRQCETCISGYFGDPTGFYGIATMCSDCQCSGNIDLTDSNSCDRLTGVCISCLSNTAGLQCERCADGFYGDAVAAKNCTECDCDIQGSANSTCDYTTGQCVCLDNVIGQRCDQCRPGYYSLGMPSGCEACDCDPLGSTNEQCDDSGMCQCLPGVTGRSCDQCLPGFFAISGTGCRECSCSPLNSDSAMCDVSDGACLCLPGSTGDTCQQCIQNFFQTDSGCTACPDCYQDIEGSYNSFLQSLDAQEVQIEDLLTETADLIPFDDRLLLYQEAIYTLQEEASELLQRQDQLLVVYNTVLMAANVTLRDSVARIDGSLDVLRRTFTTVYVITFSAQELLNATISEFQMAVDLVRRIEETDIATISQSSDIIRENAMCVSTAADDAELLRANFTVEVEGLQNATYEILATSASILERAEDLVLIQDEIWAEIDDIGFTYSGLDSDLNDIDSTLSSLEIDLLTVTNRLSLKYGSLIDVPMSDDIIYLTRNVTETESFIRNDVLSEIANQIDLFMALNQTYTNQRLAFENLFQETLSLGLNISNLLELIGTAYEEANAISDDIQGLIDEAEMVAENLENFNNSTFMIADEVAEALEDVESVNEDASEALQEARVIVEALEDSSVDIRTAKEVASNALNITTESFQEISSVDTGSIVASVNASLQSCINSTETISALSDDINGILMQLQALSTNIAESASEVTQADLTNDQTSEDTETAESAVFEVQEALDNLQEANLTMSDLEDLRQLITNVRSEYESADLANVYGILSERLVEQRATRERFEAELNGLSGDVEHLRRINSVLPTSPYCSEGE